MIKQGTTVFYIEDLEVYSGQVYDIEKTDTGDFIFSIDGYGTCEGPYRIFSTQIGKTVFLSEEKAKAYC